VVPPSKVKNVNTSLEFIVVERTGVSPYDHFTVAGHPAVAPPDVVLAGCLNTIVNICALPEAGGLPKVNVQVLVDVPVTVKIFESARLAVYDVVTVPPISVYSL
jgi:hypothetical protein